MSVPRAGVAMSSPNGVTRFWRGWGDVRARLAMSRAEQRELVGLRQAMAAVLHQRHRARRGPGCASASRIEVAHGTSASCRPVEQAHRAGHVEMGARRSEVPAAVLDQGATLKGMRLAVGGRAGG